MAKPITLRPGQKVKVAGQYILATADGEPVLDDAGKPSSEATLSEDDVAPPTPEKGLLWLLVDASRHKDTPPDAPVVTAPLPGMPLPPAQDQPGGEQ